jgi:hypothetical protein
MLPQKKSKNKNGLTGPGTPTVSPSPLFSLVAYQAVFFLESSFLFPRFKHPFKCFLVVGL